jgi:hypothetical protein
MDKKVLFQLLINYYNEFDIFKVPNLILTLRQVCRDLNSYQYFTDNGLFPANWLKFKREDSVFGHLGGILMMMYNTRIDYKLVATVTPITVGTRIRTFSVCVGTQGYAPYIKLNIEVRDTVQSSPCEGYKQSRYFNIITNPCSFFQNVTSFACNSKFKGSKCCSVFPYCDKDGNFNRLYYSINGLDKTMSKLPYLQAGARNLATPMRYIMITSMFMGIFKPMMKDDAALSMLAAYSAHFFVDSMICQSLYSDQLLEMMDYDYIPIFGYVFNELCRLTKSGFVFSICNREISYKSLQDILTGKNNYSNVWDRYSDHFDAILETGELGLQTRAKEDIARSKGIKVKTPNSRNYSTIKLNASDLHLDYYGDIMRGLTRFLCQFIVIGNRSADETFCYEVIHPEVSDYG